MPRLRPWSAKWTARKDKCLLLRDALCLNR
jgi:hypothetical protein